MILVEGLHLVDAEMEVAEEEEADMGQIYVMNSPRIYAYLSASGTRLTREWSVRSTSVPSTSVPSTSVPCHW
jgi:hypothetical protein